jgi:DNA polymerase III subunit epsilon
MKIIFFDTETTGTPKNYNAPMLDVNNWPRVTQLAWIVTNEFGEISQEFQSLIKPDGWEIPKEKFFLDNNMSTERCESEGQSMPHILNCFIQDAIECDYLVAHNISFDYNILGAEMIRYEKKVGKKLNQICTMKSTTDFCQLPGPYGFKWPKLEELHRKLFNCEFEGAHDALFDVRITVKCFFELLKLNIIKLN